MSQVSIRRRRTMSVLLAILLCAFAVTSAAAGQQTIRGTVVTPDGEAVSGAKVVVSSFDGSSEHSMSASAGGFEVSLPITKPSSLAASGYVSIFAIKDGWGIGGKSGSRGNLVSKPIEIRLTNHF